MPAKISGAVAVDGSCLQFLRSALAVRLVLVVARAETCCAKPVTTPVLPNSSICVNVPQCDLLTWCGSATCTSCRSSCSMVSSTLCSMAP